MAIEMEINSARALANCDAVVDALDATTGATPPANPECRIYAGAAPGSPGYADSADPTGLIVSIPLNNPAFNAAFDQNPNARAGMDVTPTPSATAAASGTALSFRMKDRNTTTKTVWQGNAGLAAATPNLVLSNTAILTAQAVQLTAWTVDQPEGPGT